jgi:hypothetical protein
MNISKDLKKAAKKIVTDPIFDELFEQSNAAKENRFFINLRNKINTKNYELPTLQGAN